MTIAVAAGFGLFVVASLLAANVLYDRTQNFIWSRKLAHALVGLALLSTPIIFDSPLVPVVLTAGLLLVFIATHTREIFYGVAQRGRLSEIYFTAPGHRWRFSISAFLNRGQKRRGYSSAANISSCVKESAGTA